MGCNMKGAKNVFFEKLGNVGHQHHPVSGSAHNVRLWGLPPLEEKSCSAWTTCADVCMRGSGDLFFVFVHIHKKLARALTTLRDVYCGVGVGAIPYK